ncbi:Uncharacterized protein dnm_086860 [Desulfonema magnum]|uniref:Uncharacterized protein n=1 Tax=Desulfonema magnum TaxID=45655 RepID=A0A975BVM6_9BACT|nr:Uncharacterized protein dnm_086860 [Desulfonema magnum]
MCPTFYTSEKISHKNTKESQRDFVRLRAFVAKKTDMSPPLIRKNQTQKHKGTTERLRETSCLRAFVAKKTDMSPPLIRKNQPQRNHKQTS